MGGSHILCLTHIPDLRMPLVSDPPEVLSDHSLHQQKHHHLPQPLSHMYPLPADFGAGKRNIRYHL